MSTPSSPPNTHKPTSNPMTGLIRSILSNDGDIMLAAIISLLLVILFVLLLHIYAKWFLVQARQRSRSSSGSIPHVLSSRLHHFHTFTVDTIFAGSPMKGLESSVISSIPQFVFKSDEQKHGLECVICLSVFEDEETGRKLPKCGHAFHVECIDMWLHCHSNCPLCRALVFDNKLDYVNSLANERRGELSEATSSELNVGNEIEDSALEIVVEVPNSENDSVSEPSSSSSVSSQASSLGGSLKRMLSRNRSERKSSSIN
ncbi:unnamed protein product [Ilex paraguariensis]|uniref:RING-type E3 ubiquitin transferase n=1 Tax=Ilex paraguariensis TaxID=185542 RepID=A0ABC8T443_9AQUA